MFFFFFLKEKVALQEKLSSLRSYKEQLEGKMMEQYHTLDNKKRAIKEKPTFVEGTANVLISKVYINFIIMICLFLVQP